METTTERTQAPAAEHPSRIAPQLEQAKAALTDWNQRAQTFIRERPGTALLGAVALGYLVGRLASRR